MPTPLAIYGCSHPTPLRLVEAINRQSPTWEIIGFIDDTPEHQGQYFWNYPVLGNREILPRLIGKKVQVFNNVSGHWSRCKAIAKLLESQGCLAPTLIHPAVDMGYVKHGHGCLIPDGCVVGANSVLGNYVNLRLNSTISHDNRIEDYVLIGPGVTLSGRVTLREASFIGAGATILPELTVGAYAVVGAGAVVTKDVAEHVTVAGVPARILKSKGASE